MNRRGFFATLLQGVAIGLGLKALTKRPVGTVISGFDIGEGDVTQVYCYHSGPGGSYYKMLTAEEYEERIEWARAIINQNGDTNAKL